MKSYRIKHKRTGLFYRPTGYKMSSDRRYIKTNLSKRGKLYDVFPSWEWFESIRDEEGKFVKTSKSDWEIICYISTEEIMPL